MIIAQVWGGWLGGWDLGSTMGWVWVQPPESRTWRGVAWRRVVCWCTQDVFDLVFSLRFWRDQLRRAYTQYWRGFHLLEKGHYRLLRQPSQPWASVYARKTRLPTARLLSQLLHTLREVLECGCLSQAVLLAVLLKQHLLVLLHFDYRLEAEFLVLGKGDFHLQSYHFSWCSSR